MSIAQDANASPPAARACWLGLDVVQERHRMEDRRFDRRIDAGTRITEARELDIVEEGACKCPGQGFGAVLTRGLSVARGNLPEECILYVSLFTECKG